MRFIVTALTLAALAGIALAAVTGGVYQAGGSSSLTGYVTNDIRVITDSDWLLATLIVTPDANGQIYQYWYEYRSARVDHPVSATSVDIGYDGDLARYDSFVTDGLVVDGSPIGSFSMLPATEHGYSEVEINGEDQIALTYFTTAADDIGDLALARVTLADTATGTWYFEAYTAEFGSTVPAVTMAGHIDGGLLSTPEPASLLVMLGGGLALLRRRRK